MTPEDLFDETKNKPKLEDLASDQNGHQDQEYNQDEESANKAAALSDDYNKASPETLKGILRSFVIPVLSGLQALPLEDKTAQLVGDNPAIAKFERQFLNKQYIRPVDEKKLARAIYDNLRDGEKRMDYLVSNGFVTNIVFDGQKIKSFELRQDNGQKDKIGPNDEFLVGPNSKYFVERYLWARQKLQITDDGLENQLRAVLKEQNLLEQLKSKRQQTDAKESGAAPKNTRPETPAPSLADDPDNTRTVGNAAGGARPATGDASAKSTPTPSPADVTDPPSSPIDPAVAPTADSTFSSGLSDSKGSENSWLGLAYGLTFGLYGKLDDEAAKVIPSGWLRYPTAFLAYQLANRAFAKAATTDVGGKLGSIAGKPGEFAGKWLVRTPGMVGWAHTEPVRIFDKPIEIAVRGGLASNLDWVNSPRLRFFSRVDRWLDNKQFTDLAAARKDGRAPGAQVLIMLNNTYRKFSTNPAGRQGDINSAEKENWKNFYNALGHEYKSWSPSVDWLGKYQWKSSWFTEEADNLARENLEEVKGFRNRTRTGEIIGETPKEFCLRAARKTILDEMDTASKSDYKPFLEALEQRAKKSVKGQILEREACVSLANEARQADHLGKTIDDFLKKVTKRNDLDIDQAEDRDKAEEPKREERLNEHAAFAKNHVSGTKLNNLENEDPAKRREIIDALFKVAKDVVFEETIALSKDSGKDFWKSKSARTGRERETTAKTNPKTTFGNNLKAQTQMMVDALSAKETKNNASVIGELQRRLTSIAKDVRTTLSSSPDITLYDCLATLGYKRKLPDFADEVAPGPDPARAREGGGGEGEDPARTRTETPTAPSETFLRDHPKLAEIIKAHGADEEALCRAGQDELFGKAIARYKRTVSKDINSSDSVNRDGFLTCLGEVQKEMTDAIEADPYLKIRPAVKELVVTLKGTWRTCDATFKADLKASPAGVRAAIVEERDAVEDDKPDKVEPTSPPPDKAAADAKEADGKELKLSEKFTREHKELADLIQEHREDVKALRTAAQDLLFREAAEEYSSIAGRNLNSTTAGDKQAYIRILESKASEMTTALDAEPGLQGTRLLTRLRNMSIETTKAFRSRINEADFSPAKFVEALRPAPEVPLEKIKYRPGEIAELRKNVVSALLSDTGALQSDFRSTDSFVRLYEQHIEAIETTEPVRASGLKRLVDAYKASGRKISPTEFFIKTLPDEIQVGPTELQPLVDAVAGKPILIDRVENLFGDRMSFAQKVALGLEAPTEPTTSANDQPGTQAETKPDEPVQSDTSRERITLTPEQTSAIVNRDFSFVEYTFSDPRALDYSYKDVFLQNCDNWVAAGRNDPSQANLVSAITRITDAYRADTSHASPAEFIRDRFPISVEPADLDRLIKTCANDSAQLTRIGELFGETLNKDQRLIVGLPAMTPQADAGDKPDAKDGKGPEVEPEPRTPEVSERPTEARTTPEAPLGRIALVQAEVDALGGNRFFTQIVSADLKNPLSKAAFIGEMRGWLSGIGDDYKDYRNAADKIITAYEVSESNAPPIEFFQEHLPLTMMLDEARLDELIEHLQVEAPDKLARVGELFGDKLNPQQRQAVGLPAAAGVTPQTVPEPGMPDDGTGDENRAKAEAAITAEMDRTTPRANSERIQFNPGQMRAVTDFPFLRHTLNSNWLDATSKEQFIQQWGDWASEANSASPDNADLASAIRDVLTAYQADTSNVSPLEFIRDRFPIPVQPGDLEDLIESCAHDQSQLTRIGELFGTSLSDDQRKRLRTPDVGDETLQEETRTEGRIDVVLDPAEHDAIRAQSENFWRGVLNGNLGERWLTPSGKAEFIAAAERLRDGSKGSPELRSAFGKIAEGYKNDTSNRSPIEYLLDNMPGSPSAETVANFIANLPEGSDPVVLERIGNQFSRVLTNDARGELTALQIEASRLRGIAFTPPPASSAAEVQASRVQPATRTATTPFAGIGTAFPRSNPHSNNPLLPPVPGSQLNTRSGPPAITGSQSQSNRAELPALPAIPGSKPRASNPTASSDTMAGSAFPKSAPHSDSPFLRPFAGAQSNTRPGLPAIPSSQSQSNRAELPALPNSPSEPNQRPEGRDSYKNYDPSKFNPDDPSTFPPPISGGAPEPGGVPPQNKAAGTPDLPAIPGSQPKPPSTLPPIPGSGRSALPPVPGPSDRKALPDVPGSVRSALPAVPGSTDRSALPAIPGSTDRSALPFVSIESTPASPPLPRVADQAAPPTQPASPPLPRVADQAAPPTQPASPPLPRVADQAAPPTQPASPPLPRVADQVAPPTQPASPTVRAGDQPSSRPRASNEPPPRIGEGATRRIRRALDPTGGPVEHSNLINPDSPVRRTYEENASRRIVSAQRNVSETDLNRLIFDTVQSNPELTTRLSNTRVEFDNNNIETRIWFTDRNGNSYVSTGIHNGRQYGIQDGSGPSISIPLEEVTSRIISMSKQFPRELNKRGEAGTSARVTAVREVQLALDALALPDGDSRIRPLQQRTSAMTHVARTPLMTAPERTAPSQPASVRPSDSKLTHPPVGLPDGPNARDMVEAPDRTNPVNTDPSREVNHYERRVMRYAAAGIPHPDLDPTERLLNEIYWHLDNDPVNELTPNSSSPTPRTGDRTGSQGDPLAETATTEGNSAGLREIVDNGPFLQDGPIRKTFQTQADLILDVGNEFQPHDFEVMAGTYDGNDGVAEGRLSNFIVEFSGTNGRTFMRLSYPIGTEGGTQRLTALGDSIIIEGNKFTGFTRNGEKVTGPIENLHKTLIIGVDPNQINSQKSAERLHARREVVTAMQSALNTLTLDDSGYEGKSLESLFVAGRGVANRDLYANTQQVRPEVDNIRAVSNAPDRGTQVLDAQTRLAEGGGELFIRDGRLVLRTSTEKEVTGKKTVAKEINRVLKEALLAEEGKPEGEQNLTKIADLKKDIAVLEDPSTAGRYLEEVTKRLSSTEFAAEAREGVGLKRVLGIAGGTVGVLMIGTTVLKALESVSTPNRPILPTRKSDEADN